MGELVLGSETIFEGRYFSLQTLRVRLPNGEESQRDIVLHPGAVAIVAIDDRKRILLVRQFRIAIGNGGAKSLELPAGTLEVGEEPLACAHRELREETGYRAAEMETLGGFYAAPGYTSEYIHLFRAARLHYDPLPRDADEFIELERLKREEAQAAVISGEINDAKTIIGIGYA